MVVSASAITSLLSVVDLLGEMAAFDAGYA